MAFPDPFLFAGTWDQINIGPFVWGGAVGGKIRIEGATRFYKVDQKDGQGLDGATQTYRGVKPKPFKLHFYWWNAQTHLYWGTMSSQLFIYSASKPSSIPPVVQVYHPALALLSISAILIDEVGQVNVNEDTKLADAIVVVRQFLPPPPISATVTPVTSLPGTGAPSPAGITALQAENIATQAQIDAINNIANAGTPGALPH